jgi:hypothetical protein
VERRPRKDTSLSATQEFPNIPWGPEVYYRVNNSTSLVPILSQMNPVRTIPLHFFKIYIIIIIIVVVVPSNIRDLSLFGVCPSNKHCPSARYAYAAYKVGKNLDMFAIGAVSLNHIYTRLPKSFNIIC